MGNKSLSIISTLPYTMTTIIDSFFNDFPNVKILQVPLSKENLQGFIENGKYDLCITTERMNHSNLEWVPLFEEEIFLTVPSSFKEVEEGIIDLLGLKDDFPFIGLTERYQFRQFTDQFCKSFGFTPFYQVGVEEATMILQLVKSGRGVAFTPETAIPLQDDNIKHLKIKNGKFTRTIGLLKHYYLYPTKISQAFIEHCKNYFQKYTFENGR